LSLAQRRALVDRDERELPLRSQAQLLGISRSGLYYHPTAPSPRELAIKHRLDELYTATPFYGSRKLCVLLRRDIGPLSRKTVQRYMQEMGITAIYPGPNLSKRATGHRVYPYLLRQVSATAPNQVWGIDITYIRLRYGWLYLVAIIDWYARYVVSWELSETLALPFVLAALEWALTAAHPQICNSDQGSHFTSPQYTQRLEAAGIQISMDGKGRALDNVFTERFWRSIKYEEIYLADYAHPKAARQGISRYITFYNQERPHQALAYHTPAAIYHRTVVLPARTDG